MRRSCGSGSGSTWQYDPYPLFVAIVAVIISGSPVEAQDRQTHPPTKTLNGSTAYTLNRGIQPIAAGVHP